MIPYSICTLTNDYSDNKLASVPPTTNSRIPNKYNIDYGTNSTTIIVLM